MQLKVNKKAAICFFLLISPLEPRIFELYSMSRMIYNIIMLISVSYLCLCYLYYKIKPKRIVIIFVGLQIWFLITTILNHGLVSSATIRLIKFTILCLTIDYYSNKLSYLLKSLMLHFEIYVYANFLSIIFFPNGLINRINSAYGLSSEWILGWHHYFKVWFIPSLLVAWLYRDYFKKTKRCVLLSIVIVITESFWGPSTGLTGVILYLALLLVPWVKKILTPKRIVLLATFLIITIVFVQRYDYLTFLLKDFYSGNLDFTGRLNIWRAAINAFLKSPILGYGVRAASTDVANILGIGAWATHCHNHILQIMFEGGLIGLLLFLYLIFLNIRPCVKYWRIKNSSNVFKICLYALFVYLIIGITEQYQYVPMYLILLLPYYLCNVDFFVDKTSFETADMKNI